jgi:DNA-binding transcriptional ArsR family regulator
MLHLCRLPGSGRDRRCHKSPVSHRRFRSALPQAPDSGFLPGQQLKYSSDYLTVGSAGAILKRMLDQMADLDRVFQALADPGRRVMVERLSQGPASVSELARPLAMSLAAVLQHVQVLEASGLVRTQKTGRTRTCSINPAVLRSAEQWIADRRALWERRLDRLGEYLENQPPQENR